MTNAELKIYNPLLEELDIKRGTVACQNCGHKREGRTCQRCGYDACFIRIGYEGTEHHFFSDQHGKAFSYQTAVKTLLDINCEIKDHTFNPVEYKKKAVEERRFENAFERFLEKKESSPKFAPSNKYRTYYNNYLHYFDGYDVRDIKLKHLDEFYSQLPQRLSAKYKNNIMSCLFAFIRWLLRWGEIKELPTFPELDPNDSIPREIPEYDEQQQALNNIPDVHRDIIEFLMETGMRPAEACVLKIKDINFKQGKMLVCRTLSAGTIRETTKGHHKLRRTLSTRAYEIAKQNSLNRDIEEFLFINPITVRGYRTEFLRKMWKKYSGVPYHNYANRHALATQLIEQGAGELEVMQLMGHKDIRSTRSYYHPTSDRQRELLDKRKTTRKNKSNVIEFKTPPRR